MSGGHPMNIEILTRQTCARCRGAGKIDHPDWKAFWDQWIANNNPISALQDGAYLSWFRAHGYEEPPQSEIECPGCRGQGTVHGTITLPDLIDLVQQLTKTEN